MCPPFYKRIKRAYIYYTHANFISNVMLWNYTRGHLVKQGKENRSVGKQTSKFNGITLYLHLPTVLIVLILFPGKLY